MAPLLSVVVAGAVLNCHFFQVDEIEFDLNPVDVTGPQQAAAVAVLMRLLGEVAGKMVVLTEENKKDAVLARYIPLSDHVVWIPLTER